MSTYQQDAEGLIAKDMEDLVINLAEAIKRAFFKTTSFLRAPSGDADGASITMINRSESGGRSITLTAEKKTSYAQDVINRDDKLVEHIDKLERKDSAELIERAL